MAVEKRETAIRDSLDVFYSELSRMLEVRKKALLIIWAQDDVAKRTNAVKAIWRGFGQAWREQAIIMRDKRRQAWEQYRTSRYECGFSGRDEEMGGFGLDSQY